MEHTRRFSEANHFEMVNDEAAKTSNSNSFSPIIQFYLVRHGQTIANEQDLVVGQSDSPLSMMGERQAKYLGETPMIRETKFWRRYVSDLGRTRETALLLSKNSHYVVDSRLREVAKGAREGFPKVWTYDQALRQCNVEEKRIPLLETADMAWKRIYGWMYNVVCDSILEQASATSTISAEPFSPRKVLVVSHAGTLRLLLHKLVPEAHPLLRNADETSSANDYSKRFHVPNTSVTIIDVIPKCAANEKVWVARKVDDHKEPPLPPDEHLKLWTTSLVKLTWTGHLNHL